MSVIYHIATASDWEQARRDGQYTTSTRGRTLAEQGFIHASTAEQVAPVANVIYKGLPDLLVLVIDTDRVGPEIKWEPVPGWDAPFPHIYGPLNADAVVDTRPFEPARTASSPSTPRAARSAPLVRAIITFTCANARNAPPGP